MRQITGYVQKLPNGRVSAELRSASSVLALGHMTPQQALDLADELVLVAAQIAELAEQQEAV